MISTVLILLLNLTSLTILVNSQTCQVTSESNPCSSNSACGCLPMASFDNLGVCGLLGLSCSSLSPCQMPSGTCERSDHICVRNFRCSSTPVCYPLAMIDQRLCPPASTPIPTEPTITTTPSILSTSTTAVFSGTTKYSDILSNDNPWFPYTTRYFQLIEVIARTSGLYNLTSVSYLDTYGCLYLNSFNLSSESTNKLLCNDDTIDKQFHLTYYLTAGVRYVLLFTTHGNYHSGRFTVVASGPDYVQYTRINVTERAPTIYSLTTPKPAFLTTSYIHSLTNDSKTFHRNGDPTANYYYQAIEIHTGTAGVYTFTSGSFIDAYGYMYVRDFDPSNPLLNKIAEDGDSAGFQQFQFTLSLQSNLTYVLVFTTAAENVTGQFVMDARGPAVVHFNFKE